MGQYYNRVQRGMVFWANLDEAYHTPLNFRGYNNKEYKTSIQRGKRPWLVVSNDKGNSNGYVCTVVPITSEIKTKLPVHVEFTYEGVPQSILCEQIRVIDSKVLGEYLYTLGGELMRGVERALVIQLGIRSSVSYLDIQLDNVVEHLQNVVNLIIEEKTHIIPTTESGSVSIPKKEIEDAAIQLGVMLEDLTGVSVVEKTSVAPTVEESQPIVKEEEDKMLERVLNSANKSEEIPPKEEKASTSTNEEKPSTEKKPVTKPTSENTQNTKRKYIKWTPALRREYLDNCAKLSPEEVMKKWEFSTLKKVFSTKYICRRDLGLV